MALLTTAQVDELHARLMREFAAIAFGPCAVTKPELRAAIVGLDGYLDANQTAINQSIPQPARTALTQRQKAEVLGSVAAKRAKETNGGAK